MTPPTLAGWITANRDLPPAQNRSLLGELLNHITLEESRFLFGLDKRSPYASCLLDHHLNCGVGRRWGAIPIDWIPVFWESLRRMKNPIINPERCVDCANVLFEPGSSMATCCKSTLIKTFTVDLRINPPPNCPGFRPVKERVTSPQKSPFSVGDILRLPRPNSSGLYRLWRVIAVEYGALHQESHCELQVLDCSENKTLRVPVSLLESHPGIEVIK